MQQKVILENQQAILDRLNSISRQLNEKAKKKGLSPLGCNSNASGRHSSVKLTNVNTKATKMILPSSADEQETASTSGMAKSAKMLQPLFPPKKAINVDDDS